MNGREMYFWRRGPRGGKTGLALDNSGMGLSINDVPIQRPCTAKRRVVGAARGLPALPVSPRAALNEWLGISIPAELSDASIATLYTRLQPMGDEQLAFIKQEILASAASGKWGSLLGAGQERVEVVDGELPTARYPEGHPFANLPASATAQDKRVALQAWLGQELPAGISAGDLEGLLKEAEGATSSALVASLRTRVQANLAAGWYTGQGTGGGECPNGGNDALPSVVADSAAKRAALQAWSGVLVTAQNLPDADLNQLYADYARLCRSHLDQRRTEFRARIAAFVPVEQPPQASSGMGAVLAIGGSVALALALLWLLSGETASTETASGA